VSDNSYTNIGMSGGNRYPSYYGPGGRLVFVDSALEAVNKGSTTIGIKTHDFAILSSQIKPTRPLVEPSEKIFTIDDNVGATGSGYIGDILQLVDEIRLHAQKHRVSFETPIEIGSLARHISSYLHSFTIYSVRPQAASILIAGRDQTGIQLYQIDPSGTYFRGSAFAIGQSSEIALEVIQQGYKENMDIEQAIQLSNNAIEKALAEKPLIATGVILKEGTFKKLLIN
jgi:proteasome alpha subunit